MLTLLLGGGSHGARLGSQGPLYFLGVDVGQKRDPSALVLVERLERDTGEKNWVTYERVREVRRVVRLAETMPLGTEYPEVVERVRDVVQRLGAPGRCQVAVDATGVGGPVVEMLKRARLGCAVTPVVITGGEKERQENGQWMVPKRDLVQRLVLLFEQRELTIAGKMRGSEKLLQELAGMRAKMREGGSEKFEGKGVHDDLVLALALACWKGRDKERHDIFGTRNIGIYW